MDYVVEVQLTLRPSRGGPNMQAKIRMSIVGAIVILLLATLSEAADLAKIQKQLEPYYNTYRPDGSGPFPAVMMVSGCSGFRPSIAPTGYTRRAEALKAQGFLVIFVDYLARRRLGRCFENGRYIVDTDDVAEDILASGAHLRSLSYVNVDQITAMGWSYGGGGVLAALGRIRPADAAPFQRAVAFYPVCRDIRPWKAPVPVLMLLGALDDVAPADACQSLVKKVPAGTPVDVHIYPEARHAFDTPELPPVMKDAINRTLGYNEAAATAAWDETYKFLKH